MTATHEPTASGGEGDESGAQSVGGQSTEASTAQAAQAPAAQAPAAGASGAVAPTAGVPAAGASGAVAPSAGAQESGAQETKASHAEAPDSVARGSEAQSAEALQLQLQLAQLQAERDALSAKLDRRARRKAQGSRIRKLFVLLLVALSIVFIPLTATVTWAHQTVFNTNRWEQTVGPIVQDPAVISAVSTKITDEIYNAVDPEQKISQALSELQQQVPKVPSAITALAGPIASGMKGFLNDQVNKVLSTEQFQQIWVNATRVAQQQVVAVLNGDSKSIQTVNGQVVLNLVPLLNQVLANMSGTLSSLLGRSISLPAISGNELPSVVCEKISTALGRPLPATCGQIPLFPASQLDTVQTYVGKFNRWFVGLLILTPLLIIGAIWLSRRHRRTALQIAIGGVVGLVVVRRLTMYLEGRLEGAAKNQAAAEAIVSQVLHLFFNLTLVLGIIGLVFAALLLITGPYPWARATRSGVRRGAVVIGRTTAAVSRSLAGKARDDGTLDWIRAHKGALQIGGVAVAVVLLLLVSLSPLSLLIIGILLAAYLFGLSRVAPSEEPPEDRPAPPAPPSPSLSEPFPVAPPAPRSG